MKYFLLISIALAISPMDDVISGLPHNKGSLQVKVLNREKSFKFQMVNNFLASLRDRQNGRHVSTVDHIRHPLIPFNPWVCFYSVCSLIPILKFLIQAFDGLVWYFESIYSYHVEKTDLRNSTVVLDFQAVPEINLNLMGIHKII